MCVCVYMLCFSIEYLDEVYGDKKLYPTDPWEKALMKEFLDAFGARVSECILHTHSSFSDSEANPREIGSSRL